MKLHIFASTAAVLFSAFNATDASSIRGVAITSDLVDSAADDYDYFPEVLEDIASNFEDQLADVTLTGREVNIDVQFPHGTRLSIEKKDTNIHNKKNQICDVQNDGDKIMIKNASPYGLDAAFTADEWITCAFHVVFPGHSDGCSCELKTIYSFYPRDVGYYYLLVNGCGCFHVTDIEGDGSAVPKGRNAWPCGAGCYYAPQMKLIVAPK